MDLHFSIKSSSDIQKPWSEPLQAVAFCCIAYKDKIITEKIMYVGINTEIDPKL